MTALLGLSLIPTHAALQRGQRGPAEEFPPGLFTDGGHYDLEDFKGKVLVLYLYEQDCPTCRGKVPERNAMVESYRDKPVKFIAVAPRDSFQEASSYARDTKLMMPIFADGLGVMERRYGENISLQNIYQFKVIDPDGQVVGFTPGAIDKAAEDVKWKYKESGYDKKLNQAVECFEWNQYEAGMKALRPHLKSTDKTVAASAQKLFAEIKAEGEKWKTDADAAVESNPVLAHDLYARIATVFAGDDLAKSVDAPLKKLKTVPAVKDELAARKQWGELAGALSNATPAQKGQVIQFCQTLAKKYASTPTGAKARALAEELQGNATNAK
jgi:peroxiredoxin